MKRILVRPLIALCFAGSCFFTSLSFAEVDKAAAESLFQAGKNLMVEGKFQEACYKFAESQKFDPAPGTLLNLGKCYETLGKTASAWASYREASVLANRLGQYDREKIATDFAKNLEKNLPTLKIEAKSTPGLVVRRDGLILGEGAFGIEIPVDPGEHVIEASAPDHVSWLERVAVEKSSGKKQVLIPTLEKQAITIPKKSISPSSTTSEEEPKNYKVPAYILGGIGIVSMGVGAGMAYSASNDKSQAEEDPFLCPNHLCTEDGKTLIDSAKTKATFASIGIGVGATAFASGVVLLVISDPTNKESSNNTTFKFLPRLGSRGGLLQISGSF